MPPRRRSKKRVSRQHQRRAAAIVGATVLVALAGLAFAAFTAWSYPRRPHRAGDARPVKLIIGRGMSAGQIAQALAEQQLIARPAWFRFYATERGAAQKIKPGQYTLTAGQSPSQILDALVAGIPDEEVTVTIPEGKNLLEVAALLEEAGVCKSDELLREARSPVLLGKLGVPGDSCEGYLFPDSYKFRPATPAAKVIGRLVKRAKEVYAELRLQHKAGLAALQKTYRFDDHQVVLMASLVEKETGAPEERPRIAGVFLNRLRLPTFKPHLLQTDPTIVYGCTVPLERSEACQKFEGRIRRIHLDDPDNPYNTYTHEGLPPGPICNPGRAALEAVMKPDQTPYLYFVSKNDGTHQFSKTLQEHTAAVDKYQRSGG